MFAGYLAAIEFYFSGFLSLILANIAPVLLVDIKSALNRI
jgi:hypothetical protein